MKYLSTRNKNIYKDSCDAVLSGLAEDGGLFVPEFIPKIDFSLLELPNFSYEQLASRIINLLLPDFGEDVIKSCVAEGYFGKFDVSQKVDLKYAAGKAFLELYHGPTSAFKDMALCVFPRLLTAAAKIKGTKEKIMILTATSGDTGKAALEAFADVPGTGITVFYPEDGVSDIQKLQMKTQEGSNVIVCAVKGNFDDVQNAVKIAFSKLKFEDVKLSSANSINIARLMPQVAYYFWAYGRLAKDGKITIGDSVSFAVPTGNFGDIFAGYLAKKMGLPVNRLLCASNKNNILTDFINTGIYDKRRDFYTTSSPSMDILISSNLERLLYFASDENTDITANCMKDLNEKGVYTISPELLQTIRSDFDAEFAGDEEAFAAIKSLWESDGYLIDTHTAVGYACAQKAYKDEMVVVLSTASPFKFSESILTALGLDAPKDCFESIELLEKTCNAKAPERIAKLKEKSVLHSDVIEASDLCSYVEKKKGK